jgi:hypothetical protein
MTMGARLAAVLVCTNLLACAGEGGAPRGLVGGYEHGRVWGWAQDLEDALPVVVDITVDGERVASVLANEPRPDLFDKGLHESGDAGFSAVIDELEPGAEVEAFVEGVPLGNGPCVVQGGLGVSSCTEGTPRGIINSRPDGRVWGWAQMVGDDTPVSVRIEVDGEPVATVLADRDRPDLVRKRLHHSGRAGFQVDVGPIADASHVEAIIVEHHQPLRRAKSEARRVPRSDGDVHFGEDIELRPKR